MEEFKKMTQATITETQRALLLEIFRKPDAEAFGVHAARFQTKHDELLDDIDQLIRAGWIEQREIRFFLRLPALSQLATFDTAALDFLNLCRELFSTIRARYKDDPDSTIAVRDLMQSVDAAETDAKRAIVMFCSLALFGCSNDLNAADAYIAPTNTILRYRTFDDVMKQYEKWREDNDLTRINASPIEEARVRVKDQTKMAKHQWFAQLPATMRELFDEVYVAMEQQLRALPAMGLRAIVDLACTERVSDAGTFVRKLDLLVEGKHITPQQRIALENVLEVGHASSHRGHMPTAKALRDVLLCVEHLVFTFYAMDPLSVRAKRGAPPKTRPNKPK